MEILTFLFDTCSTLGSYILTSLHFEFKHVFCKSGDMNSDETSELLELTSRVLFLLFFLYCSHCTTHTCYAQYY